MVWRGIVESRHSDAQASEEWLGASTATLLASLLSVAATERFQSVRTISLIPATDPVHAAQVAKRTLELNERVPAIAAAILAARNLGKESKLLQTAVQASKAASKTLWLRQAAASAAKSVAAQSACRRGCTHCCHIPVMVSEAEAVQIGREISRRAATDVASFDISRALEHSDDISQHQTAFGTKYVGVACTFLSGGECSIYESRPLACRTQVNLDRDALLCELVEGVEVSVPYLDMSLHKAAYLHAYGLHQRYADLREWFPA